ncbi:MAG: diguanylate cyclase [Spirochaetaceae bacterium]|nr:diguanylate cyclase [Spirochaetaceae bacterium]
MDEKPYQLFSAMFLNPTAGGILSENGFTVINQPEEQAILSAIWQNLGVGKAEFFSKDRISLIHPEDREAFLALKERLDSGATDKEKGQFRFISKDGRIVWLELSFRIISRDEQKKPILYSIHDTNITELIAARDEIRERLVEIESLKELLVSINQSLDFNETMSKVISYLHRVIPFDSATVQGLDEGILHIVGSYGYPESAVDGFTFPIKGMDNPSARAVSSRRPIICNDVQNEFKGFKQVENTPLIKSWLGIPLVYEGRAVGLLALDSSQPNFYNEHHVRIASNVADHISIAVEHARLHTQVKEEVRTDKLTGVANRYGLETLGQDLFEKARDLDQPIGVLMIDIDHFKEVNDRDGHSYGDQVLRVIAKGIAHSLRTNDYLVRFGGEEFVTILPNTSTREAFVVAERLRQSIPQIKVDATSTCPTISIGVFSGVPGAQDSLHEFIRKTDLALYDAKQAGRDKSRVWNPSLELDGNARTHVT